MVKGLNEEIRKLEKSNTPPTYTELFLKEYDRCIEVQNSSQRKDQSQGHTKVWKPSKISMCEVALYYYFTDKPANFSSTKAQGWRRMGIGTAHHRYNQEDILAKLYKVTDAEISLLDVNKLQLPEGTRIIERKDYNEFKVRKALETTPYLLVPEEDKPKIIDNIIAEMYKTRALGIKDTEWKFQNDKYNISGMIDGALTFLGKNVIWEFKTIKPDEFKFLNEVHKKYLEQGAMYYLCLGIPYVLFHYEDKGDQIYKVFEYEYKPVHAEWVINKMERINQCVQHRVLPPKPTDTKGCTYCEYKSICKKGEV